jgi:uncharacterized membrane protein YqaE (UPF0057 family)
MKSPGSGNPPAAAPFLLHRPSRYRGAPGLDRRSWLMDLLRIVLAILLPPLGVFLQVGIGLQFWINILLTLLGYIPGIVHAIWIIARR